MPAIKQFQGNDAEAIEYIMRTNKRRNLTSSQWACIATEAEEMLSAIAEAVEAERRRKQAETQSETMKKPIPQLVAPQVPSKKSENETRQKAAEIFNTNRTYISEAQKLKEEKQTVQFVEPSVKDNSKLATQKAAEIFNTNRIRNFYSHL
jgi:hypothetical protein